MAAPIYELKDVEQRYPERIALRVDHLSIHRATITGLVGPNGSGKSTLLDLLGFVRQPTRGQVFLKGEITEPFNSQVRTTGVTLLNQEPFLLKRSVFDNVAYGLKVRGDVHGLSGRIAEALEWVGLPMAEFQKRRWYELSGGEAQRVALAARLVLRPGVLLLDEPTARVDADSARLIKSASLRARREWGTTLVVASHDLHWLYSVCDDTLYLHKGRVFASGLVTVLEGEWQPHGKDELTLTVGDNQSITAAAPNRMGRQTTAVVSADAIRATAEEPPDNGSDNHLVGTVSRLLLEKRSSHIIATIDVGRTAFTMRFFPDQQDMAILQPGRQVWLSFSAEAVKWI